MKKTIVVAVVTSVITAGLMAVTFAGAATPKRHAPATAAAVAGTVHAARPVSDVRMRSALRHLTRARIRCQTLACINRQLTRIGRFLNCMDLEDVTQYGDVNGSYGYRYSDGGDFLTTALDFTESGDSADASVITWTCG
jgi:hypothetical protein